LAENEAPRLNSYIMEMNFRLSVLKVLAQAAPAGAAKPAAAAKPKAAPINIRTVPGFNPNLFAAKPLIVNDLNRIINHINDVMTSLTNNQIDFATTWKTSTATAAEFSPTVVNLLTIAKWIYSVITARVPPYSIAGLRKIGEDLMTTVRAYSFPDQPNLAGQLIAAARAMIGQLSQ
jgi:hypothetical protein